MKRIQTLLLCALAVGLCGSFTARAGEEPAAKGEAKMPEMTPEQMAEMQAWQKAGAPGPQHERFKKMVGDWHVEMKMWPEGAEEPMLTEAKSSYSMLLGGRYLQEHYQGNWMGTPFEAYGLTAYDNITGKYQFTWIDNTSTGIFIMKGDYDEKTKTQTAHGTMHTPLGKEMKIRMVTRDVSDDEVAMVMYETPKGGEERKHMEVTYTRK